MKPMAEFADQPQSFWALVKAISATLKYSARGEDRLQSYSMEQLTDAIATLSLSSKPGSQSLRCDERILGAVLEYLNRRAAFLNEQVRPLLMDRRTAKAMYLQMKKRYHPHCHVPMNKRKGKQRHPAYFTGTTNILTESALRGVFFDDNPKELVTVTKKGELVATLSRWMDGVFPAARNPLAVWEVKEYYSTTTFGSRVADAVYETMMDGFELLDLRKRTGVRIRHYLLVDGRQTWWDKGKSYLCRLCDMMHMGFVDEVIFGKEVEKRWPQIVRSWRRGGATR